MKFGAFQENKFGDVGGKITALGLGVTSVILDPDKAKRDGKPYYRIVADPAGEAYVIGVAFANESEGLKYYTLLLDSPLFPMPVKAALFPREANPKMFDLIWDRPDAAKPKAEHNASADESGNRRSRSVHSPRLNA